MAHFKKVDVILPELKSRGGDISKEWYIEFHCFSEKENKLIRYRKTFNINREPDHDKRMLMANKVLDKLTSDLKTGWRPWSEKKYIYTNYVEYEQIARVNGRKRNDSNQIQRLISEFLSFKEKDLKEKSFANYVSKLRIFSLFLNKNYPDAAIYEITNDVMLLFWNYLIMDRKLDSITIEKYYTVIYGLFSFLIKKKIVEEIPMTNLPRGKKIRDEAARPINKIDLKIILHEIKKTDPQLYLGCLFQFYVAIRPGNELRGLRIRDIDLYTNRVVVTDETAKTVRRTVDVPDQLIDILFEYNINRYASDLYVFGRGGIPSEVMLGKNTLRNRFNKFRDKLNFPKTYKFYSMKHTGAGMLLDSGATIEEIRDHMGHFSIESTDYYIRRHFGNRNQKIIKHHPSPD
jgi:integrase